PGRTPPKVSWQQWDDSLFDRAAKENKLLLLDLEAVWCHWCHVMDEKTYGDSRVIALIKKHYIPVRVDQAARPDLAARYQEYGWPATIILDAKGRDLRKKAGFIEPDEFVRLLSATASNPSGA